MGITGLLKGLKFCSNKGNICEFSSQSLAIDVSSWLHKSVYSISEHYVESTERRCVDKLCIDTSSKYIISRCQELLLHARIHRIFLVFDGKRCPLKGITNKERERKRQQNLAEARKYKKMGQHLKSVEKYKACIKVTNDLTIAVARRIQERFCHTNKNVKTKMNHIFLVPNDGKQQQQHQRQYNQVELVWSPYEADAQLVKLCVDGITQAIVTEDSDVLVYSAACHTSFSVIFKLDRKSGECDIFSMDWLLSPKQHQLSPPSQRKGSNNAKGSSSTSGLEGILSSLTSRQLRQPGFGVRLFVQACVLAGCDYAPSQLNGVGLITAFKLVRENIHRSSDNRLIDILASLSGKKIDTTILSIEDYQELLIKSEAVFYYHPVKCIIDGSIQTLLQPSIIQGSDSSNNNDYKDISDHYPTMNRFNDWSFLGENIGKNRSNDDQYDGLLPQKQQHYHQQQQQQQQNPPPPIQELIVMKKNRKGFKKQEQPSRHQRQVTQLKKEMDLVVNPYRNSKKSKEQHKQNKKPMIALGTMNPNSALLLQHKKRGRNQNLFESFSSFSAPNKENIPTATAASRTSCSSGGGLLKGYLQEKSIHDVRFVKRKFPKQPQQTNSTTGVCNNIVLHSKNNLHLQKSVGEAPFRPSFSSTTSTHSNSLSCSVGSSKIGRGLHPPTSNNNSKNYDNKGLGGNATTEIEEFDYDIAKNYGEVSPKTRSRRQTTRTTKNDNKIGNNLKDILNEFNYDTIKYDEEESAEKNRTQVTSSPAKASSFRKEISNNSRNIFSSYDCRSMNDDFNKEKSNHMDNDDIEGREYEHSESTLGKRRKYDKNFDTIRVTSHDDDTQLDVTGDTTMISAANNSTGVRQPIEEEENYDSSLKCPSAAAPDDYREMPETIPSTITSHGDQDYYDNHRKAQVKKKAKISIHHHDSFQPDKNASGEHQDDARATVLDITKAHQQSSFALGMEKSKNFGAVSKYFNEQPKKRDARRVALECPSNEMKSSESNSSSSNFLESLPFNEGKVHRNLKENAKKHNWKSNRDVRRITLECPNIKLGFSKRSSNSSDLSDNDPFRDKGSLAQPTNEEHNCFDLEKITNTFHNVDVEYPEGTLTKTSPGNESVANFEYSFQDYDNNGNKMNLEDNPRQAVTSNRDDAIDQSLEVPLNENNSSVMRNNNQISATRVEIDFQNRKKVITSCEDDEVHQVLDLPRVLTEEPEEVRVESTSGLGILKDDKNNKNYSMDHNTEQRQCVNADCFTFDYGPEAEVANNVEGTTVRTSNSSSISDSEIIDFDEDSLHEKDKCNNFRNKRVGPFKFRFGGIVPTTTAGLNQKYEEQQTHGRIRFDNAFQSFKKTQKNGRKLFSGVSNNRAMAAKSNTARKRSSLPPSKKQKTLYSYLSIVVNERDCDDDF